MPKAKSRGSSRRPRLACPVAQQFYFAAGVDDFPRRMEVDAVVAPEIRADQAPGIKTAARDGDQNGLRRRFGQLAPAITLQLDRCARSVIGENIVYRDDSARVFLLGNIHHLSVNLVALFFRLKL